MKKFEIQKINDLLRIVLKRKVLSEREVIPIREVLKSGQFGKNNNIEKCGKTLESRKEELKSGKETLKSVEKWIHRIIQRDRFRHFRRSYSGHSDVIIGGKIKVSESVKEFSCQVSYCHFNGRSFH